MTVTRALMDRYGAGYIFLYCYPKGMRTIGALPVGLATMPWMRFTALNAASASVWMALLVGGGFLFGAQLDDVMATGRSLVSVAMLALFLFFGWLVVRQQRLLIDRVHAASEKLDLVNYSEAIAIVLQR